jgi:hypothetical protein
VGHGHLRPARVTHAADVLWTYSLELYELLVLRCGMPLRQPGRFAADAMTGTLLPSEQPDIRP